MQRPLSSLVACYPLRLTVRCGDKTGECVLAAALQLARNAPIAPQGRHQLAVAFSGNQSAAGRPPDPAAAGTFWGGHSCQLCIRQSRTTDYIVRCFCPDHADESSRYMRIGEFERHAGAFSCAPLERNAGARRWPLCAHILR